MNSSNLDSREQFKILMKLKCVKLCNFKVTVQHILAILSLNVVIV